MTIPLQFESLYDGQGIFVWSDCLLDLGTDHEFQSFKSQDGDLKQQLSAYSH